MSTPTGKGRKLTRCSVCGINPVAMSRVAFCFACWPGGPVVPPPCLKCGSRTDYYAAGLCIRCHPWGDPGPDSCRDCLAWGARRTNKWLCRGCVSWRAKYLQAAKGGGIGPCRACGRTLTLGAAGFCRLCYKQAIYVRGPNEPFDPIAANKHGQQLFFADMFSQHKNPVRRPALADAPAASTARPQPPKPHWLILRDQQLPLFPATPDLAAHGRAGLHQRAHPDDVAPLEAVARELAAAHHWTSGQLSDAIIGVRIMLGIQDNGRAPIRASEVEALRDIDLPVWSVIQILSTAGALIEDRTPQIDAWFEERIDQLPEPMANELRIWFDIKKNGITTPPRMRPRGHTTIQLQLGWALPALRAWAAIGHTSLREISREDVLNALPPGGSERPRVGQGLKSIFHLLKARKIIFVDPIARIQTGEHQPRIPLPLDAHLIATRLRSDNPETAVVVALIAFHGLRLQQLQRLRLTDTCDGRLSIEGRVILLADPVRDRLAAYLTYRNNRWPESLNTHLFINSRSWRNDDSPSRRWFRLAIGPGMTARQLREDRILNEADATGGEIRALADLFGLSINASTRYASTLEHSDLVPAGQ